MNIVDKVGHKDEVKRVVPPPWSRFRLEIFQLFKTVAERSDCSVVLRIPFCSGKDGLLVDEERRPRGEIFKDMTENWHQLYCWFFRRLLRI